MALTTRFLFAAASAVLFTTIAAAQTKLGVINMQQAILDTAEIKKASLDLQVKYKPRQTEMDKIRKEMESAQQQIQAGQGKLSPITESDLNATAQRKQRELQRLGQDLQEEADAERSEVLGKCGQRMQAIVRKLAEERGLDAVTDVSSLVYFKAALDLTKEATAEFDKTYPVPAK
jgi:outer membrane protein